MNDHINNPETYNKAGNYNNSVPQLKNNRPLTCREREFLLDEIDYWQRAYYIACERREKDKKEFRTRCIKLFDIVMYIVLGALAFSGLYFIFNTLSDWIMYGWK